VYMQKHLLCKVDHTAASTALSVRLLYGAEIRIVVICAMTQCRLVGVYQYFRGTYCLSLLG
jgi:hypothetical protein